MKSKVNIPVGVALFAALALSLLFLMPGGYAQAQQAQQSFTYAENGTGPVATFAATDPEGVTPIVWSLLDVEGAVNEQNLGIFTDGTNGAVDGVDDDPDDVKEADVTDFDDFAISQSGVLTFAISPGASSPNFETPGGGVGDNSNTYRVVVQASDGGVGSFVNWFKVTVTVTDEEEDGTVAEWTVDADGDDTPQTPGHLLQFQPEATLTVVNPTDSDGGVTNVRWQWYRASSRSAMGTAIDGDDAKSATYIVSDTSASNDVGMYLRVVATYSDNRGPNKTASYVSENPVQAARDDNTAPAFALTAETRGITENTTGDFGSPLMATDDDGDILTYSKADGGADNAKFTIDRATGQLRVASGATLNYEGTAENSDTDANDDNDYVVMIKATDSHGIDSAVVTVTITVTDLNENPTFGAVNVEDPLPVNIQGMVADHREDTGNLDIASYTATDPEGASVTLSLMGDDEALFELAGDTQAGAGANQVLSFKEKPDFETPGDRNEDNVYEVTVRASDDVLNTDRMLTVKVTDADEVGEVELSSQDAMIGIELTATLTDSDTGAPNTAQFIDQKWSWHRLVAATAEAAATEEAIAANAIPLATTAAYTPVVLDRGKFLKAKVTYTDRTRDEDNNPDNNTAAANPPFVGFMNTVTSGATTAVRNNPSNQAPEFAEGSRTIRLVEENTEALTGTGADEDDDDATDNPDDNVGGGPVVATDDDNDTVNYTLTGSDMFRVRTNGQIEVTDKAKLDYETSRTHTVTLTANDGTNEPNGTATITVSIHVTDLDEKPTITDKGDSSAIGEQRVEYAENSTGPVIRLMARDPEGVTPIVWSLLPNAGGIQDLGIEQAPDEADDVGDDDIADRGFFEVSQNGELSFKIPRSYELDSTATADGDAKNYRVVVQASDGGVVSHVNWFKVTVNVTNVNEDGTLAEWTVDADGDGTVQTPDKLLQFQPQAILTVVSPMDNDGGVQNVQWKWFRSRSKSATGGTVIDGATSAIYEVVDSPADPNDVGSYLRVTATYEDATGPGQTATFVSLNPVQAERRQTNTDPEFPAASVARRITEDTVGNVGAPVSATDADRSDILTYSKADGADNDSFAIDRTTGQLMVGAGVLDFESPADENMDNSYVVTVMATDSSGGSAEVTVTITVTNVNDAPEFGAVDDEATPPGNTEGMAADHQEKTGPEVAGELNIATYTATDPEGAEVTLLLMGDDAALFELADDTDDTNGVSQLLSFKERPDFEMPGDRKSDNVYQVTVRASDSVLNADRMVTIKVIDFDEAGEVELPQDALIGVELTATFTDSDGGAPNTAQFIDQKWSWHRLGTATETIVTVAENEAQNNEIEGATSDTYTPVVADRGMYLRAMVTYTDRTRDEDNNPDDNTAAATPPFVGFMNSATSNATTAVRDNPSNQAPVFAEGSRTVRLVEENTEALTGTGANGDDDDATDNPDDNVGGGPVTATDADQGQEVTYTLTGSDMFRVRANGQIEVSDKANLDYETSSSHIVILTATDTSSEANNSATIEVSIHVTDLDERPVITEGILTLDGPMGRQDYPENGTEPVGTYTMGGPEAAGATMSLEGDDAGDFTIPGGMLRFRSTPNFEMPMDMGENNEYMVTVVARKGDFMAKVDVTVTVTNEDEDGMVTLRPMRPSVGTEITATLTDPDMMVSGTTWQWSMSESMDGSFTPIDTETSMSYTPVEADDGYYLKATASYTDGEGPGKSAYATTVTDVDEEGTGTALSQYDRDGNGKIEIEEIRRAFTDYIGGRISIHDMSEIFTLYIQNIRTG